MYIEIIIIFIIIIKTKCSIVQDSITQSGVHVTDYCPEIGVCKEGSHVMCTHYDPNHKMGPTCAEVQNFSMTEGYAAFLLDLINSMRSKAALGLAMGYDKQLLPRAYGLFRLEWDPELATLAQVWANQCVLQFDKCRATKNFSDPGQLASITRFISPQWIPLSKRNKKNFLSSPGFNTEKILYAFKSCVGSWYSTSEEIDAEIITDRSSSWSYELLSNPYLQIIDGSVTHMGCGASAFKDYQFLRQSTQLIYNVIRLVCNFSSRVRDRRGIYNTEPPTNVEYTAECGCPPGYDEDSGCLCYESNKNQSTPCKKCRKPGEVQLVVVPIITVDDYPRANADSIIDHKKYQALSKIQNQDNFIANRRNMPKGPLGLSTTSIIKLASRKLKEDIPLAKIKNDVEPRKDFSISKNLLSNYLNKRRTYNLHNNISRTFQDNNYRRSLPIKPIKDLYTKRKTFENWADKYDLIQIKNTSSNFKTSKDDEAQLLGLLNNLENEANKINISKNDRSVLNNGIRKIYSVIKNNRDVIFNKKITEKKPSYAPIKEDHKLTIHEDLFKNISKQKDKPRNFSIMPTKLQNNTHLIKSLSGKELETYSYKKSPGRHVHLTLHKNMYDKENLRNYLKSDDEYFPDSRKIYYSNRINDIRKKLKANYIKHMKSRRGLQIRPTFGASYLQFRQTLPKF